MPLPPRGVDSQERVWLGTNGGGVGVFDGAAWTTYTTANTGGGLASNSILSLAAAGDQVLIGTSGAGLSVYHIPSATWTTYTTVNTPGLASNTIRDIVVQDAYWWLATPAGLTRSSPLGGDPWDTFTSTNSGLSDDNVATLALDDQGRLWIGACGGVDRFDGNTWLNWNTTNSDLPGDCIQASVIAPDGDKWFAISAGDIDQGVVRFDDSNWIHYTPDNTGGGLKDWRVNDLAVEPS